MSYFRASTANPTGWRPGTVLLGNMASVQHQGPDWKTVAAQYDAAQRAGRNRQMAIQRNNGRRMSLVDAAARGDRTRVRMPRLSGLGMVPISQSNLIVPGAQYAFHFTASMSVAFSGTSEQGIAQAIATDGNFGNVQVAAETGGFQVRFTFNGQVGPQSTVGSYGLEMQNVINSHALGFLGFAGVSFLAAEGGPAIVDSNGNTTVPVITSPGQVNNAVSSNSSGSGAGDGSSFDWNSFWEGMGLTAGVGTALAVGVAFLIFKS